MSALTDLANTTLAELLTGKDFSVDLPDLSDSVFDAPEQTGVLYDVVTRIENEELTVGEDSLTGDGMFDLLMRGFKAHLVKEYDSNRISGAEYTKAYIALTQAAMSNATQFLLGRTEAYWSAINSQLQARMADIAASTGRVELENAKVKFEVIRLEAMNQEVLYALNKMRLAGENVGYETQVFNLDNILPKNEQMLEKQIEQVQNEIDLFDTKEDLLQEQVEAQRAQTMDTRTDGITPITGSVGKQKDLYNQQITSYQRDAEIKAAKIFSEAWITMKTLDEGLAPPTEYANANLDDILETIRTKNGLVVNP